jgi:rubredoxin
VTDNREPIPMRLPCPSCGSLHLDVGEFATKVHHTHACQECGMVWRPAVEPTVGVAFLPGFKNDDAGAGFCDR